MSTTARFSLGTASFVVLLCCSLTASADIIVNLDPNDASNMFDSDVDGNGTVTQAPSNNNAGLTMNVTFAPSQADIDEDDAVGLLEIGGNSNGTGLYLFDGEVVFLGKMDGHFGDVPTFDLTDYDSGMISVKSTFGPLTADTTYMVAAIYDPLSGTPSLDLAVQPAGGNLTIDSFTLTGVGSRNNWSGNDTITSLIGPLSAGGGNEVAGDPFNEDDITANPFAGTKGRGLLWNAQGEIIPEPSTLMLCAIALTGLGWFGWRRRE